MANAVLMLLDDDSLLKMLGNGTFKIQSVGFEEAKAMVDMHTGEGDIVRCFGDVNFERIVYDYLDMEKRDFPYQAASEMTVGQDAIAFRLYISESATKPIAKTAFGNEAKKIQNVYIHCQFVSRIE